jgi:hypothetical protein
MLESFDDLKKIRNRNAVILNAVILNGAAEHPDER